MLRHLPGQPSGGVQRCVWCGLELIRWTDDEVRLEADPLGPFYWTPFVEVVNEGGFTGTNRHQETGELIDDESLRCVPNVEGVDIQ